METFIERLECFYEIHAGNLNLYFRDAVIGGTGRSSERMATDVLKLASQVPFKGKLDGVDGALIGAMREALGVSDQDTNFYYKATELSSGRKLQGHYQQRA